MKVYFAGAIRGGRSKVLDYQKMVETFEKSYVEVLTKHVADANISEKGEDVSLEEIYKRDINWLKECDIVFADITIPSLGIGYELAYAESLGKHIYAVYEKDANVSGFIRGNRNIQFFAYENLDEVLNRICGICSYGV